MNKKLSFIALTSAICFSTGSHAVDVVSYQEKVNDLRQIADSCILVKDADPFSEKIGNCYSNVHSKVKSFLNTNLQKLPAQDKTHYLNTVGAFGQLQQKKCDAMFPNALQSTFKNQISECKLKVDLGLALLLSDKYL